MAGGHGVPLRFDKGKEPLGQATDSLFGHQVSSGVHHAASNSFPVAPQPVVLPTVMASNATDSLHMRAGPSVHPQLSLSEEFPPLSGATRTSWAQLRRDRAALRRPYRSSDNREASNTAYSSANSGPIHPFSDAWQGPQFQSAQPIGSQQQFPRSDAGGGFQPTGGGHVYPPTCNSFWQQAHFPLGAVAQPTGSFHVSDRTAAHHSIRSNAAQRMEGGHVGSSVGFPSFPL